MTNKSAMDLSEIRDQIEKIKVTAKEDKEISGLISHEIELMEDMLKKLQDQTIEISAYGEVSTGKSSLMNVLAGKKVFEVGAQNGVTTTKEKTPCKFRGKNNCDLVLVDTPGLNEYNGEARSQIAQETAMFSDIVIFVADSDLNDIELKAIQELHDLNKPLIIAINKADVMSQKQRMEIFNSIKDKVGKMIADKNIVFCAADPIERVWIEQENFQEVEKRYTPKAEVFDLQNRILDILDENGLAIAALNASLFALEMGPRITKKKMELRRTTVNNIIQRYMIVKATGLALNPIPLLDIFGAIASDSIMIKHISVIYGMPFDVFEASSLCISLAAVTAIETGATIVMDIICSLLKITSLGLSTIITGMPQAVAAGYSTYIIGQATNQYFTNGGSWGQSGLRATVESIIESADKDSIIADISKGIKVKLFGYKTSIIEDVRKAFAI